MATQLTKDKAVRLYSELGALAASVPDFGDMNNPQTAQWLGRAHAIIEEVLGDTHPDTISFVIASKFQANALMALDKGAELMIIVHRVLARLERLAPMAASSAFIGAGEQFTALSSLNRVISEAKCRVMFVDPYADANLLTDFAVAAAEGVNINILAGDGQVKPGLAPAVRAWKTQYGSTRPVELRTARRGEIHDRAIFVDDANAWSMGTSFNAVGKKSPTILQRIDTEVFTGKKAAYEAIWQTSSVTS